MDIGYAVCFLALFSDAPHEAHFAALKHVCKYLRATKSWGLMFRRPEPIMDLPLSLSSGLRKTHPFLRFRSSTVMNLSLSLMPPKLRNYGHGDLLLAMFSSSLFAWKSRVQPVVATSSTEAKFFASVTCANAAKYLCGVLQQLEAICPGVTPLFVDNQAAIAMVNENWPTPRAAHIKIQHFAIQE